MSSVGRVDAEDAAALAPRSDLGIHARVTRGTAASAQARKYAAEVEKIAELGWRQAQGA